MSPPDHPPGVSAEELQAQARNAYRRSAAEGRPLSRHQLGALSGRSESWARDRIAEARRDDNPATAPDSAPTATGQPAAPDTDSRVMPQHVPDMTPERAPAAHHPGARFTAWFGFTFGSVVSVAANWLAAWLPAPDMPPDWHPGLAAQLGAAVWPIALVVSVEVLTRTAWGDGRHWLAVRFGGVTVVALGSGVISYNHIHDVLLSWGYDPLSAGIGPLVVDGLMVISGFALLTMGAPTADNRRDNASTSGSQSQ